MPQNNINKNWRHKKLQMMECSSKHKVFGGIQLCRQYLGRDLLSSSSTVFDKDAIILVLVLVDCHMYPRNSENLCVEFHLGKSSHSRVQLNQYECKKRNKTECEYRVIGIETVNISKGRNKVDWDKIL